MGERLPPQTAVATSPSQQPASHLRKRLRLFFRQAYLLTRRYAAIWCGDFLSLLAMAGQALLVAVLLGILFGDVGKVHNSTEHALRCVNLMFLLGVSSFWFGCNNAAKEIVKERVIYTRERDFNLLVSSYYISKLLLLTFFSWIQVVLLFVVVRIWCGPPGPFLAELLVLLTLALAGVTLGLAISILALTEEMAITLIPMAIIPQIILSGTICPLEGLSKWLARIGISTYWGKLGLDSCLPEDVAQSLPGLERGYLNSAILVLLTHAMAAMAVGLVTLYVQNRRR